MPLVAVEGVKRGNRVVSVQPEIAREVVPRPEGHAHERQPALHGDGCDACDRAVASGSAEDLGLSCPCRGRRILALAHEPSLDAAPLGLRAQLVRVHARTAPRARVDQEERPHSARRL